MFKGLGNLGNIASMMSSLQSLPQRIEELNERMRGETVSATSGCDRVTVTMNGVGEVQTIDIKPELTGEELEHAIRDATNAAGAAAKQLFASAISDLTTEMDLNLPGMDGIVSSLTGGR